MAALLQKNAAGCDCYQAGYLNGQQADEWTLADSLELTAGRMLVAALTIPPAIYLAAVLVVGAGRRWRSPADSFCRRPRMRSNGGHGLRSLRAWRRLKGGASET